uniref:Uncharacterized protein LOC111111101 isoform X2 n=1 Tax=Crassostrea virginica TaxID=6565 RepID=A0A8B8BJR2_CRAVI|nr:uncharacterized protein LOC111111101 isoform X2 [Crassostrea virginica]
MNGISYTGTGNDNSTGVEITSSTSSGSSWTADVIWYCIMIPVVEVLLQEMPVIMEFVFKKVHEMPLPCGETCTAVGKKEQSCTPMDNTCVHDETMEKTETGDANDGAKYKQRKYFIVDTKDHEMIDR